MDGIKLAVGVLTCNRFEYTLKTVKSFTDLHWTDLKEYGGTFEMYYLDDASTDQKVCDLMDSWEITPIAKHKRMKGCSPSTDELLNGIHDRTDAPYTLYLQNDFECVDILPMKDIDNLFKKNPDIAAVRLFHDFKDEAHKVPVSKVNLTDQTHPSAIWTPCTPYFEVASIHWGLNPIIMRTELIPKVYKGIKKEADTFPRQGALNMKCARTLKNYFYHIGAKKTPNGRWGRPRS